MENGEKKWGFAASKSLDPAPKTVRSVLTTLREKYLNQQDGGDQRPPIIFGHGDPSAYPCFRTASAAEDAVSDALRSADFNSYSPAVGILPARSSRLPQPRSPIQAKSRRRLPYNWMHPEITIKVLARPGANILLPRPGYPDYEVHCTSVNLEIRYFDLLPERNWEFDLDEVASLADHNTVAMVVINPGNPCGNVYGSKFLEKVAETAKKLGVAVIADEVYGHLAFGSTEYVPMGVFASTVPVLTLGSISKRWIVPGWRIGWLVVTDPNRILQASGIVEKIKSFVYTTSDPATIIQGPLPRILERTEDEFFSRINNTLRRDADILYEKIQDIPCISCPNKPEGAMSAMLKLNLSELDGIDDDMDFCIKLTKEESTVVLPGVVVGMKNWLRFTFAVEPTILEEGLARIKSFYQRHARKS